MDEVMPGGRFARPVRRGATVERDAGPGQRYVHELLGYLETRGFELAPRYLGMTGDGRREILSYIDGEIGYPPLPEFVRSEDRRRDQQGLPMGRGPGWRARAGLCSYPERISYAARPGPGAEVPVSPPTPAG